MKKKFTPIINTILIFSFLIIALKINWPNTVTAAATTPSLPKVAIHISEYTQTLETLPASITTPRPPTFPNTTGYEWWLTAWHYRFIPEVLIEALRSDGTQYDIITDADISNGNLLFADGSPKYPILISLASEAINDDEIAQLRAFVSSGGNLFIGSSSFTRNIDGSSRGNFVLSSEMGLNMRSDNLQNWYENETFTKVTEHRLVNHIPDGSINWFLPLTSEEIPLGPTGEHVVHQNHYAWAVNSIDLVVIAQGSSGPILTTKSYGDGVFIYYGILQPLVGIGGNDDGMYSYMIFRNAIEWAFERVNIPIVKISPWQYPYDLAFIVRHDFENDPVSIQSIEFIAQSEQLKGVTGEYYFSTGVVRLGSEDHQLK